MAEFVEVIINFTETLSPWTTNIGIVTVFSLLVVIVEIQRLFPSSRTKAICNFAAFMLIIFNVGVAILVYFLICNLFGAKNDLRTALGVGISFPALLRSNLKFILGGEIERTSNNERRNNDELRKTLDPVSLNWLATAYSHFYHTGLQDIHMIIAGERSLTAIELAKKLPVDTLELKIKQLISAFTDKKEQESSLEALEKLKNSSKFSEMPGYHLAIFIIDKIGLSKAKNLLKYSHEQQNYTMSKQR